MKLIVKFSVLVFHKTNFTCRKWTITQFLHIYCYKIYHITNI